MKKYKIALAMLPVLLALFAIQSCRQEDNTTYTVEDAFTQPVATSPTVRADGTVLFTGDNVTLSWDSEAAGGDAKKWDVYFSEGEDPALYKTGITANTLTVPVVDGKTYSWKVEIADARGFKTTSDIFTFTAVDGKNAYMYVDLTTATDVKTSIGLDKTADQVVDLRLLILKKSDMSIVATIDDGISSETYDAFGDLADGDYVIGVDIYSTKNFGDFNKALNLDLTLNFQQLGIIDQQLTFPKVMTNANPCDLYRTYLASVKKAGPVYTITKDVSYMAPPVLTWKGTDADYDSEVTTTASCAGKTMTGLGFGWMLDWWGEIIVSGGTLNYTVTGNTIDIPLQKYCKTTYKGAAQPEYSIKGTGTIDNSGTYPVYTIHYDFIQSGSSIATVSMDYGWPTPYFEAVITSDPTGLKSAIIPSTSNIAKPNRR